MEAVKDQPAVSRPMKEVTEQYLLTMLATYALERRQAYKAYPNARGVDEKQLAIDEILATLHDARGLMPRATCRMMLNTERNFGFIAPTATRKIYNTWASNIDNVMSACRQFLGYRKQF